VPQAEGMERVLESLGRKLDAVLCFEIENDDIVKRLGGRTVCDKCQTPYTGRAAGSKCEKCGGTLVRRKDDEPDAIRNRLAVFKKQTAPVFDWYARNGTRIVTVKAVGDVATVSDRALQALGR